MNVDVHPLRIMSICSGIAWLDLGLQFGLEHLGIASRTVCYCERDAYAQTVLLARMQESSVDQAPICDDINDIDGRWRGLVDCIVAGFPCQPFSVAGQQRGTEDERWIWPDIVRVIRDVGPGLVFLENVPGLATGHGLARVLDSLAEIGFDAEWLHLKASAVGASHERERIFILGYSRCNQRSRDTSVATEPDCNRTDDGVPGTASSDVAQSPSGKFRELRESYRSDGQPDGGDEELAHARSAFNTEAGSGQQGESSGRGGLSGDGREPVGDTEKSRREAGSNQATSKPDEPCGSDRNDVGDTELNGRRERVARRGSHGRTLAGGTSDPVADADGESSNVHGGECSGLRMSAWSGAAMADAIGPGLQSGVRRTADTQCPPAERSGESLFAPGPADERWADIPAHLLPAVVPGLRVSVDGRSLVVDESRADQLRCAGNGCVPLQVSVALVELVRRMREATQ